MKEKFDFKRHIEFYVPIILGMVMALIISLQIGNLHMEVLKVSAKCELNK